MNLFLWPRHRERRVYAGTVLEEGELTIRVKVGNGASKYDRIAAMIEESEKLKSSVEGKAEHLADKLVPYTLAGGCGYLALHTKCDEDPGCADGRFLLRPEACDPDFRTVCHP